MSKDRPSLWDDRREKWIDQLTEAFQYVPLNQYDEIQKLAEGAMSELLTIADAAKSLHAGLTCAQDPMDVDERIARLGKALGDA